MASRTSIYTNALNLPRWVMNGEFGDLSGITNNRDISYENVAQEEIATDEANMQLEDAQRKERMREILRDRTANSRPATIRDAYQEMINAAYDAGDPITAMDYETKREAYENSQLAKQRSELSGALGLADNLSYDRLNKLYPGVVTPDDYARNQKKARVLREGKHAMINSKTGEVDPEVPYNEAMARQKGGDWKFLRGQSAGSSPLNIGMAGASDAPTEEGLFSSWFGDKPGEAQAKAQEKTVEDLKDNAPGKGAEKTRSATEAVPSSAPPRPPKPGMKWQQNKKTGEYREVPR